MRLYIQNSGGLVKFNLPNKIDGSLLFTFKSSDNSNTYSINIDSSDDKWILKSNGSVNILDSTGTIMDSISLSDYMSIPISLSGTKEYSCVFCLPSTENNNFGYNVGQNNKITIGKSQDNSIAFSQNMMFDHHGIIFKDNGNWFISPASADKNIFIFVNKQRVLSSTKLFIGDIIFMNGLRIVWMNNFFFIPMKTELFTVNGFLRFDNQSSIDNTKTTPVSEADNNITLFNEEQVFFHTPRIRSALEEDSLTLDGPPGRIDKESDTPFILSIGSSFTMLGMMSIQVFNLYDGVVNGTRDFIQMVPQMIMIIAMVTGSLFFPLLTKKFQKKLLVRKEKERKIKYNEYLKEKVQEASALKVKEEEILKENYVDYAECINIVSKKRQQFWNRIIRDNDFIEIRLGIGDKTSMIKLNAPHEKFTLDDDELYKKACEVTKQFEKINNVPITVSLKEQIITALILQNTKKDAFINSIMIQLLALHSPLDLKIVIFTDEYNEERWNYLKYLKHLWSDDNEIRFFASRQEEYKELCQFLDAEYIKRNELKTKLEKEASELNKESIDESALYETYYLVITDSFKNIKDFKFFDDLLKSQYNYGFSLLVIDKDLKNIPNVCKKFLIINDAESGMFNDKVTSEDTIKFKADLAENVDMNSFGKYIANIPVVGKSAASQLPSSINFLEMYNVGKIEQLNIRNRWKNSDPMSTLQAPVGVHTNGELFTLDLHEKFDGPHGLIAGSTGSGKSEFIITYILSMALNYDPNEVQFVLIDYKGGGLTGAFENRDAGISIPHLAGTITNLDTAEMNRTLVSIQSELKRRQRVFNEAKEKNGESTMDIYKYQRLCRAGMIEEPISHLFIVSDEFAELKAQQPDFMSELVSTARIGRSLGVHLILATQKPSGVVNDQIWSNSKFKVCLKVATRADSMEMLKRPEAASIKEAGRFYLQIGYDEYFDIGQSAWSGEKYTPVDRIIKKVDDSISIVDNYGHLIKKSVDINKNEVKTEDIGDQLTNIVKYLATIAKDDGFVTKKLWLPSLKKTLSYDEILKKYSFKEKDEFSIYTNIGEFDMPENQVQGLLQLDFLNDGNLIIYGSPGSGKENLISTIIFDMSLRYSPELVNFYIGDFGAETLKIFNKLPHVGDAFVTEENQKLVNMLKMLDEELEKRKKKYSEFGGNYKEYIKLSGEKDTFIIVALNNYEVYLETYPRMLEAFNSLFRDGFKYGICFIVSTTQQNSVRARVAQNFTNKICLKMPNTTDYRDLLGVPKTKIPVDNFGRGIVSINGNVYYEFQTMDICSRDQRTQFIKDYGERLCTKYEGIKVKKIPILPDIAYIEDVEEDYKDLSCVPIGIEKNSLETYVYNFLEFKMNLIAAKSIKNHIYFLYALINFITRQSNVRVHIIDALSIYRGNYKNVNLYDSKNLDSAFVKMYNNVKEDSNSKNIYNVYFIIGLSEFRKNINKNYSKNFTALFTQVSKCKYNTFIFLDDSDGYKHVQVEDWFRDNINNTFGIWLGEGIGTQVSLGVMSLSLEDKNNVFPCIGYPIYSGNHMVIKYVVDGVDTKDE